MTLTEEDVDDFIHEVNNIGALNSSNDAEVYDALKLLFTNHSASFFQLFLRDPTVLQNMYDDEVSLAMLTSLQTKSIILFDSLFQFANQTKRWSSFVSSKWQQNCGTTFVLYERTR